MPLRVKLADKRNAYWEPLTKTHLTLSKKVREFSDSELENLDMSGIEAGLNTNAIKDVTNQIQGNDEENTVEENNEEENNEEENNEEENNEEENIDDEEVVEEEEEVLQCQATTSNGEQCKNDAKYPEDEPKYCGVHKSKLEE